jgi:hypothetical protein
MNKLFRVTLLAALVSAGVAVQAQSIASVTAPANITSGDHAVGQVQLSAAATSHVHYQLSSTGPVTVPSQGGVDENKTTGSFYIEAGSVSVATPATVTASLNGSSQTADISVNPVSEPTVTSVTLHSANVTGGESDLGSVVLSGPADPAVSVALSSSDASTTVPASVNVGRSGHSDFKITTTGVDSATQVTISATLGNSTASASLTVNPAGLCGVSAPRNVVVGSGGNVNVYLSGKAGPSGVLVNLSSSSSDLTVPATASVTAGSNNGSAQFTTSPAASSESITITATLGVVTKTATVNLQPLTLLSVNVFPGTVTSGTTVAVLVELNGNAPVPGAYLTLSSDTPSVLTVPASVTITPGNYGGFVIAAVGTVTSTTVVNVSATFGTVTKTFALTVVPGGPAIVIR